MEQLSEELNNIIEITLYDFSSLPIKTELRAAACAYRLMKSFNLEFKRDENEIITVLTKNNIYDINFLEEKIEFKCDFSKEEFLNNIK